jgi:hypothetical protein
MADENVTKDKTIERILVFLGALLTLLSLIAGLEFCKRLESILFIITGTFAVIIFLRLKEKQKLRNQAQTKDSPPPLPAFKYLAKNCPSLLICQVFFLIICIASLSEFLFPFLTKNLTACGYSQTTPNPSPPITGTLSEAFVDFIITDKDRNQLKIPAEGTVTLLPDEKVVVKASVFGVDHLPFPGELIFMYHFSSGEKISGTTIPYIAKQSGGDILTLLVIDKTTGDQISRSIKITVK